MPAATTAHKIAALVRPRLDGMAVERGISASLTVMSFTHEGLAFNLLDTPGLHDFREASIDSGWALINHSVATFA